MRIDPQILRPAHRITRDELANRIERLTGLAPSTARRRAATIESWREFMLAAPTLSFPPPERRRHAASAGADFVEIRNFGPIEEARIEFGDLTVLVGPQATGKSLLLQTWKLAVDRGFVIPELRRLGVDLTTTTEQALGGYLGAGMGSAWTPATQVHTSRGDLTDANIRNLLGTQESIEKMLYVPAHRSLLITEHGWPLRLEGGRAPLVARLLAERMVRQLSRSDGDLFPQAGKLDASLRAALDEAVFRGGRLVLQHEGPQRQMRLEYGDRTSLGYLTWTAGQREIVPLLLALYELLPSARRTLEFEWVVVEEPEMGLHPRAIRAVMLLLLVLVARGYRVAVTTHAPIALDVVWGLRFLQDLAAKGSTPQAVALFREMFELHPDPAVDGLAEAVLGKTSRVFAFEPAHGGRARAVDISTLDPASDEPEVAGWGGLTSISSRISAAASAAIDALEEPAPARGGRR